MPLEDAEAPVPFFGTSIDFGEGPAQVVMTVAMLAVGAIAAFAAGAIGLSVTNTFLEGPVEGAQEAIDGV